MKHNYFGGTYVVTAIALLLGAAYGFATSGTAGALSSLALVAILSVLEITLSFDNAVVNATILRNWDAKWRHAFLVFGILIAVLGMRLVFPVAIVAISTGQSLVTVALLAFAHPAAYAQALGGTHYLISAFGGAFLGMIAIEFFCDREKTEHWYAPVESRLAWLGQIEALQVLVVVTALILTSRFLAPADEMNAFFFAGVLGVVAYLSVKALGTILGGEAAQAGQKIIRASIGGFVYLEMLDASFSFDGVVGAFAITQSPVLIALGLGTGAYAVRSLTLWLVDSGKLTEYRYLSHGAYYAIATLAAIMFASVRYDVPDVVTGLIGVVLIGAALLSSIEANRRDNLGTLKKKTLTLVTKDRTI